MFNYPYTNINFIINVIFIMFIMLIMKYTSSTSYYCLMLLFMNALVFYLMKRNRVFFNENLN